MSMDRVLIDALISCPKRIKSPCEKTDDDTIPDNPEKSIYILGIRDSLSASRATSLCLWVLSLKKKHTSIAVHEGSSSIDSRDRDALTNAVDKIYQFREFRSTGRTVYHKTDRMILTLTTTELLSTIQHIMVNNVLETYKL